MPFQNVVKSLRVCSTERAKSDWPDPEILDPSLVGILAGTRIGQSEILCSKQEVPNLVISIIES